MEILIFIFIIGFLGLNWPFLEIFQSGIITYLFVFWLLFIVLVALATRNKGEKGRGHRQGSSLPRD